MSRTVGRRSYHLRAAAIGLMLVIGFWYAGYAGYISMPSSSPCGRHLNVSPPNYVIRQVRIDKTMTKDGHIIGIQGTVMTTGKSIIANTIWKENRPDEPTTPRVRELFAGETYTLTIDAITKTDTAAGCPGTKYYNYIVGICSGLQCTATAA
jgi:hypothetical protein